MSATPAEKADVPSSAPARVELDETITDPEQIRAVWEAGDMGDFPCRTTPVRVTEAGAVEYVPRAELQVQAVRAVHRRVVVSEEWGTEVECGHCCTIDGDPAPWPCVTIKAMDGVTL